MSSSSKHTFAQSILKCLGSQTDPLTIIKCASNQKQLFDVYSMRTESIVSIMWSMSSSCKFIILSLFRVFQILSLIMKFVLRVVQSLRLPLIS